MLHHYKLNEEEHYVKARRKHQKEERWSLGGRYIKGRKSDRTAIWGYIYGHSYAEVKKRLAIKKMEVQQFALNVENPTFFRAFPHLGKLHFLGVKTSTSAHYHYTLQHYILPVLGPYRVQALNESILENSILEIIAPADQNHKTLGNAMSKECLTLVRRICRYAVHLHIIADDIIMFVHLGDSPFFLLRGRPFSSYIFGFAAGICQPNNEPASIAAICALSAPWY